MRHSNYDKYPATRIAGTLVQGWDNIIGCIRQSLESENISELAVELYTGVYEDVVKKAFSDGLGVEVTDTRDLMKPEEEVRRMTDIFMTDDVLFGYVTALRTITSGRATSSMTYSHHAQVSTSIAKAVLEEVKGRVDLL